MPNIISDFTTSRYDVGFQATLPPVLQSFIKVISLPILGIVVFILLWSFGASKIDTSLGKFPGPQAVAEQVVNLVDEHQASRAKEAAFYERQEQRNADRIAKDPNYVPKTRAFTGKETFIDQIATSLVTVMSGFVLAAIIAIPLGIAIGLSKSLNTAINPIIQIFKPVSPLAWLPLVTMVVSALYVSTDPMFAKSYIVSLITVTLCCLWPMVMNTSVGVASLNSDWTNVSRGKRRLVRSRCCRFTSTGLPAPSSTSRPWGCCCRNCSSP